MLDAKEEEVKKEIIRIAKISAEHFSYYKSKEPNAGNFYIGESEVEGQCSDYALLFAILWNDKYPENPAEIVVVNQELNISSGSYKIVKKITDEELIKLGIKYFDHTKSQWLLPPEKKDGEYWLVLFHPKIGFYRLKKSINYEIEKHFGIDMMNYKRPHVWAKIGDIAIDPCWADTNNTPFIGEDVIQLG